LWVCDDGHGFDPTGKTSGIGLIGMRERMRAVQGDFQIISAPDAGTEIHAAVAFPSPQPLSEVIKQLKAGTIQ
jgi:signal transduction histidine kinase